MHSPPHSLLPRQLEKDGLGLEGDMFHGLEDIIHPSALLKDASTRGNCSSRSS